MGRLRRLASAIAAGETTSADAVSAALDAAESSALNLFTVVARGEATAAAKAADAAPADARGVLHGVPVAVKDLFDVAGFETTGCSRLYQGRIAERDAPVVAALRRAGAIVVGKTNMHELAFGATNDESSIGPARNPRDPERMTGGSSGGSAGAVAAGIVPLALGTDTGGSVRIPSSLCGVTGLKTTFGLLSLEGVLKLAASLDTVGPIAEDADDLVLAMLALCGLEPAPDVHARDLRIGLAENRSFETIDPAVDAAVRSAVAVLEDAGAAVSPVALPDAERARDVWTDVTLPEFLRANPTLDDDLLSEELRFLAAAARMVSEDDYRSALDAMRRDAAAWDAAFDRVDVIAMPSTPVGAPLHFAQSATVGGRDVPVHGGLLSSKTRQVNVAGVPAISIPCGSDGNGMPVGLQLAARRGEDARLLAIARLYQSLA